MLSDSIVVLICIIGAGGIVCVGLAFQRLWGKDDGVKGFKNVSKSQEQYMREVRQRNQLEAFGDARQARNRPHPQAI